MLHSATRCFAYPASLALLITAGAAWTPAPQNSALAHDWYPLRCCSGRDCQPIAQSEVRMTSQGWEVLRTGEMIDHNETEPSPDGRFHRCSRNGEPDNPTICLFVPGMGS